MAGFCRIDLIGNLGRDPEQRFSSSGMAITNFSMAVTEKVKGEDVTTWYKVTVFNKLAEITAQYLKKGSQAFVSGKLRPEEWTDKEGRDRYTLAVIANEVKFLGGRGEHGHPGDY